MGQSTAYSDHTTQKRQRGTHAGTWSARNDWTAPAHRFVVMRLREGRHQILLWRSHRNFRTMLHHLPLPSDLGASCSIFLCNFCSAAVFAPFVHCEVLLSLLRCAIVFIVLGRVESHRLDAESKCARRIEASERSSSHPALCFSIQRAPRTLHSKPAFPPDSIIHPASLCIPPARSMTECVWTTRPTQTHPHAELSSPRLAALEASVERLRRLAITHAGSASSRAESNSSSPPQRFRRPSTSSSNGSCAREALTVDLKLHDPSAAESADDEHDEWGDDDESATPSRRSEWNGLAPRSPALHTRRLAHVPFRPTVFLPHPASSKEMIRLHDWSPPSSAASCSDSGCTMMRGSSSSGSSGGLRSGLSDSPFSFHLGSPACDLEIPQTKSYATTPPPFIPVIPLLQQYEQPEAPVPVPLQRSISRDSNASPSLQHHLGATQSHLLHLACSVPSSASSTCPPSPDLGPRGYSPISPSPVSLAALGSPSSVLAASSHNPDSPTWKLSTLAHQSGMELSARRRAREALRGKESIGRLKMIGLSSRAQQAQQLGSMPTASFVAQQLLQHDGEYDSGSDASEQTPSPIATPNSLMRRQATARTTISHRIKPLMSSQGYLNLAFHPSTNSSTASSSSGSSSSTLDASSIGAPASLGNSEVDAEVVSSYLLHLSSDELAATLHPIRTLLPAEVTALIPPPPVVASSSSSSASPAAAQPLCASPLSAPITSASSASASSAGSSLSASSADASPPAAAAPLSFSSHIPSLSSLHLSLVWLRCIARSSWRKSVPSDLLLVSFSFLELESTLLSAMRVSKHWRAAAIEMIKGSAAMRAEVAAKKARLQIKCKMRVYRRLTPDDVMMQQLLSANAREAEAAAAAAAPAPVAGAPEDD